MTQSLAYQMSQEDEDLIFQCRNMFNALTEIEAILSDSGTSDGPRQHSGANVREAVWRLNTAEKESRSAAALALKVELALVIASNAISQVQA